MEQEQKLKKAQICIHCEHYFKCKGAVDPKMCVNYKEVKSNDR